MTLLKTAVSRIITSCAFFLLAHYYAFTQDITLPPIETPYYWNVNESAGFGKIQEVQNHLLNLKYHDVYGQSSQLTFTIYNWNREVIAKVLLDKGFGSNYYNIKLDDIYSKWELDKPYTCEMHDEVRRKYEWKIRLLRPTEENVPVIGIVVNPLKMKCNEVRENKVEFYSDIQGGKAPYTVNWYVMNNSRTDFLYDPTEELIGEAGKMSVLEVNSIPDYYVLLHVKDACGNIQQKMVHLVCEQKEKKINTIFIEPLNSLKDVSKIR